MLPNSLPSPGHWRTWETFHSRAAAKSCEQAGLPGSGSTCCPPGLLRSHGRCAVPSLVGWESEIAHTCSALGEAAPPSPASVPSSAPSQGQLSACRLGDLPPPFINIPPTGAAGRTGRVCGCWEGTDRGPPGREMLKGCWKRIPTRQSTVQPDKPHGAKMSVNSL